MSAPDTAWAYISRGWTVVPIPAGRKGRPEKARLSWLKLARFGAVGSDKNSLRHDPNVLAITGIEADYDVEVISFDRHIEYLRDLAAQDGQVLCNILDELELSDQLHLPELVKKLSALVDHCDIFRDEFAFRLDQQYK